MSSPHTTGSGRHRAPRTRRTAVLPGPWRRPSHRSALKGLGVAVSALGVATAFAAPAAPQVYELTAAEVRPPLEARAEAVSAPVRATSYGVIGFTAHATSATSPTSPSATATRSTSAVSRNTSRVG